MPHVRKPKLIEQRLAEHAAFVEADPRAWRGRWRDRLPGATCLHVDLGCGKGVWTTRAAYASPQALLVGIDRETMCVSFAAERAAIGGVASNGKAAAEGSGFRPAANAVFAIGTAADAQSFFAPGEVDVLQLNFPTPFPRKKEADQRVTWIERLLEYRSLLAPGGEVRLKTDHQPLFDYSLEQLEHAGCRITWQTRDLFGSAQQQKGAAPADLLQSGYEERLLANGARIHALHAQVRPAPEAPPDTQLTSLYGYLPDDLEGIDYVPLGMEGALANMRNYRRKRAARP